MEKIARVFKFDGIDGCGKTTLINELKSILSTEFSLVTVKEYGSEFDVPCVLVSDCTVSELLREIILEEKHELDDIERELLWAVTSRRNNRLVLPRLKIGHDIILVDRSNLGNLAYGLAYNENLAPVFELATTKIELYDLIFWLDTPLDICKTRRINRGDKQESILSEEFYTQVRQRYKELCGKFERIIRLDGSQTKTELVDSVIKMIIKT